MKNILFSLSMAVMVFVSFPAGAQDVKKVDKENTETKKEDKKDTNKKTAESKEDKANAECSTNKKLVVENKSCGKK